MNKVFSIIISIVFASMIFGCSSDQEKTDNSNQEQSEVQLQTIYFDAPGIDGTIHSSSEWIGKVPVVVNFWGTWCPPCRKEIPDLARLYSEYMDKGVEIIGVSLNDTAEKVKNYSAQNNMNWILLVGDRGIAVKYNIRSVPTTYFIDRTGKIVKEYQGLRDYDDLKKGFDLIS